MYILDMNPAQETTFRTEKLQTRVKQQNVEIVFPTHFAL